MLEAAETRQRRAALCRQFLATWESSGRGKPCCERKEMKCHPESASVPSAISSRVVPSKLVRSISV